MPTLRLRNDELDEIESRRLWQPTPAMPAERALCKLKEHRRKPFRHTWNVVLKPRFTEDFGRLNPALKEAVIAAVSVLANAKYPTTCGYPMSRGDLSGCEIGHGYRVVFMWHTLSHSITMCFVRRNDDVEGDECRLRLPDPADNPDKWIQETIEAAIDESYGMREDGAA